MDCIEIRRVTKTINQINDNLTVISGQLVLGNIEPGIAQVQVNNIGKLLREVVDDFFKLGIDTTNNKGFNTLLTTVYRNIAKAEDFAKRNNPLESKEPEPEM